MKEKRANPERLFEPAKIGEMPTRNRIAVASMTTDFATNKAEVIERIKHYHEERSKGAARLITVGAGNVDTKSKAYPLQLGICHEGLIPRPRELMDAIHAHGEKVSLQLNHFAGRVPLKIDEDRFFSVGLTHKASKCLMNPAFSLQSSRTNSADLR